MTSHLYLVHRETLSSVISSQVLTPLEALRPATDVTLGLFTPCGQLLRSKHQPALSQIEKRCRSSGIKVGWLPSPPTRMPWLWSDSFVLRRWIQRLFRNDQPLIVRCRNATTTTIALDALIGFPRATVIYDCRGAETTEAAQNLGIEGVPESDWPSPARKSFQKIVHCERRAVEESAGVTCVSGSMVDMLRQKFPSQPQKKFIVVPCCSDVEAFTTAVEERDTVRTELGLEDKYIVSYCGSLAWYQLPQASIRVFRLIQSLRPNAHFFAITTQPEKMRSLLENAGFLSTDYTIRSVPAQNVPRLLVAADLGLMLRDDSLTNRVASPIKFGEYMAAGVPVIITPRLGDHSESVRRDQLGIEVDLTLNDEMLLSSLRCYLATQPLDATGDRERCRSFAKGHLSWPGILPKLTDWYEEMVSTR